MRNAANVAETMKRAGRPTTGKISITIRLQPDQVRAVKAIAEQRKCSYSSVIEAALTLSCRSYRCARCGSVAQIPVFGLQDCDVCQEQR